MFLNQGQDTPVVPEWVPKIFQGPEMKNHIMGGHDMRVGEQPVAEVEGEQGVVITRRKQVSKGTTVGNG